MTDTLTVRRLKLTLLSGAAVCGALAASASAQTTVSAARTTPVVTSVDGDTTIESAGSVDVTTGVAVTIDSNNTVSNAGAITAGDVDDAIGVLINNNATFTYTQSGDLELLSDAENTTETPLDNADDRFGLRVAAGSYTGDITFSSTATLQVVGDTSRGISIEGDLVGDIAMDGGVGMRGLDTDAIVIDGNLVGDFSTGASSQIVVSGENADGIVLNGSIDGAMRIGSTISATAYTDATPDDEPSDFQDDTVGSDADGNESNAEQVARQTGHGIAIHGDVSEGVLITGLLPAEYTSTSGITQNASVNVQGSGQALLIDGGAGTVTLGPVDTSDISENVPTGGTALGLNYGAYGLINRGNLTASGIYNTVDANSVRIANTTISDGIRNDGTIQSQANVANSTGVLLDSGASTPLLLNFGQIASATSGTPETGAYEANGIYIASGASLPELINQGDILATANSDSGNAYAIRDLSGTLNTITNTGLIRAFVVDEVDEEDTFPTGNAYAIDLSANTTGVTIENTLPVYFDSATDSLANHGNISGMVMTGSGDDVFRADIGNTRGDVDLAGGNNTIDLSNAAQILGNVSMGSGNDQISLESAVILGAVDVGSGNNTFDLTESAIFVGDLSNSGALDITVDNSVFILGGLTDVAVDSLTVTGSGDDHGTLGVSIVADPAGADLPPLVSHLTANSITLDPGTELRTVFVGSFSASSVERTILTSPIQNFDLNDLVLNTDGISPFLFSQEVVVDPSDSDNILLRLTRRSAAETGLPTSLQPAYEPIIQALTGDETLGAALFNTTSEEEFRSAFDQVVAGPLDAPLAYARAQNNSVTSIITQRVDLLRRDEALPRTFWLQEETYFLNRDADAASNGFEGGGFVIAGGADTPVGPLDVIGVSAHLASARYDEHLGEDFPFNRLTYGVDVYAADAIGALEIDARAGFASASSDSERNIDFGGARRSIIGEWDGTQMSANGRIRYRTEMSGFEVTPFVSADYLKLKEDGFSETGDDVLALTVEDREAESMRANAGLSLGKTYKLKPSAYDTTIPGELTPRITAAWSQELKDDPIAATYRFGDGDPFTLTSEAEKSAAIIAADIDYQNQYAKIHAGVSATLGDQVDIYTLRVGVGLKW